VVLHCVVVVQHYSGVPQWCCRGVVVRCSSLPVVVVVLQCCCSGVAVVLHCYYTAIAYRSRSTHALQKLVPIMDNGMAYKFYFRLLSRYRSAFACYVRGGK
jgi:hypothetical protein